MWTGKVEIVDLCSGFGYLGMFLSELLPASKVSKITLVRGVLRVWGKRALERLHVYLHALRMHVCVWGGL